MINVVVRCAVLASLLGASAFVACNPSNETTDGGTDSAAEAAQGDSGNADTGNQPHSCKSLGNTCGENADQSCCSTAAVAGGTFIRDYDGVDSAATLFVDDTHTASVSPFQLDVYAVTVSRFRQFVAAYPGNLPHDGDGKNPNNPNDPGWSTAWNALMLQTSAELDAAMFNVSNGCNLRWTKPDAGFEEYPVNCATWYEAYAFCIWDGGRLPTSAEYNYAESGGSEQRYYPWSNPPESQVVDNTLDVYNQSNQLPVGSTPKGNGKYGQADLAGNINQWVLDTNATADSELPGLPATCTDCALFDAGPHRVLRGANYESSSLGIRSVYNQSFPPDTRGYLLGFRCARN